MSVAECYFDESETSGPRAVFAIAGAIFRKEDAIRQADAWQKMLIKWGLPFFHMTDCANGQGHFAALTAGERDLAARQAIAIIRDTASAYVYVTVEISQYEAEMRALPHFGGPYEWCAMSILPSVAGWCQHNPDVAQVHYYFEGGAKGQSNAKFRLSEMLGVDDFKAECRFGGLSFLTKQQSSAVQAADLIAWHAGKDAKRAFGGEPSRKDFAALIDEIPAFGGHWSTAMLRAVAQNALSAASELGLPLELLPELDRLSRRSPKSMP